MADFDRQYVFRRIGLYVGFIAAFTFMVFIVNYQFDHLHRYTLMLLMIPLPFIALLMGWKKPLVGGILFIVIGALSIYIEKNVIIAVAQYIPGRGFFHSFYYTLFFVSLPLLSAGIAFVISAIKK